MSMTSMENYIRTSLETYFRDLRGAKPAGIYGMVMNATERPLLEAVMAHANGNQARAAQWLGINRNTLRKKLQQHNLIDKPTRPA